MSMLTTHPSIPIEFTSKALVYVRKKLMSQSKKGGLRISIKKSGCSGWLYVFEYGEQASKDELIFCVEEINIFIHHQHVGIFQGALVDYVRAGLNGHLT